MTDHPSGPDTDAPVGPTPPVAQIIPFSRASVERGSGGLDPDADEWIAGAGTLQDPSARAALARAAGEDRLLADLLDAIADDSLHVYYQTQHSLQNGRVLGVEALVRLSDATNTMYDTESVISIAERFQLMPLLGRQVLQRACREFAMLRAAGAVEGRLALNMSSCELTHPGYSRCLLDALARYGLQPEDLELEITESMPLTDGAEELLQLRILHEAGVRLAIDDFGTGYSSWATIASLPVGTVKLDRSIVSALPESERTRIMVAHLVRCGLELGYHVVAEGLEQVGQQALLLDLGCSVGQGFSLAAPKPAVALLR